MVCPPARLLITLLVDPSFRNRKGRQVIIFVQSPLKREENWSFKRRIALGETSSSFQLEGGTGQVVRPGESQNHLHIPETITVSPEPIPNYLSVPWNRKLFTPYKMQRSCQRSESININMLGNFCRRIVEYFPTLGIPNVGLPQNGKATYS